MEDDVKVLVKEATSKGYAEAKAYDSINLEQPSSKTRRGRVGHQVAQTLTTSCNQAVVEPFIVASRGRNPDNSSDRTKGIPTEQRFEPNKSGCSNTITTVQKDNYVCESNYRIRKLTPSECYALMGFTSKDCKKASVAGISNSQLYKQAGNSIVVQVMEALFRSLGEKYEDFRCPGIKTSPN